MAAASAFSFIACTVIKSDNNTLKTLSEFNLSKLTNPKSSFIVKANVRSPSVNNGNSLRVNDISLRALSNQLSNLSLFLGAITTIFKETTHKRNGNDIIEEFGISANFLEDGLMFCQNFSIRSYEVGADGTVSLETLISHLQVTSLLGDGLGSTPEMCKRKLIWVPTKMQIVVDRYPAWVDTIRVENWLVLSGKLSCDVIQLFVTTKLERLWLEQQGNNISEISLGGSTFIVKFVFSKNYYSNWVMMSKETRRLYRFPDEVREEMSPFCKNASPNLPDNWRKL